MNILFDQLGNPISPRNITDSINGFEPSYTKTVGDIINRSQNGVTRNIFFENVAQLMPNFKMTRKGPFHGVKYSQGLVHDPNGQILACWSAIGVNVLGLRNVLSQQTNFIRCRLIVIIPNALKRRVVSDLRQMFNSLIPVCMGQATNGRVAASKILFAVLPEVALPVDTVMWKKLFKTIDYGDIISLMADEIITWESQTGQLLDSCDPSGNSTLTAIYNVMAMKARP